jgi:endonuclease YncB( thermonuclease family)
MMGLGIHLADGRDSVLGLLQVAGYGARTFIFAAVRETAGTEATGRNSIRDICGSTRSLKSAEPLSQRFLPFCRAWRWPTIFVGQASVIDGDTAEMHGVRIRLWGIDAPESSQLCRGEDSLQYHCGAQAANELDAFIDRRPINCVPVSLDPYGRTVATCSGAGRDLGEWLVQNGLALDWPNTRRAGITKLSARLSAPARESGRAATSSRGSIVHISAQADDANAHP